MHDGSFTWKGRLGPIPLEISRSTFTPSTISSLMASVLEVEPGDSVIDVGCGSGILAILAAKLGAGSVNAVDLSPDVVELGTRNAENSGVGEKITFYHGDLFEPLPADTQADVIIGDVSGIPDALADSSGWFPSGKGGGVTGCELPIRMLRNAVNYLAEQGKIFLPTGTLQAESVILETAKSIYAKVRMLCERRIPLPPMIAKSKVLEELLDAGVVSVTPRGSRYFWEARVWELSSPT